MTEPTKWIIAVVFFLVAALVSSHVKHAVTADALRIMAVTLGHTTGAITALERRISDIEGRAP